MGDWYFNLFWWSWTSRGKISDVSNRLSRTCDQTSFNGVKLVLDAAKDAGVQDRISKNSFGFGCYAYNYLLTGMILQVG